MRSRHGDELAAAIATAMAVDNEGAACWQIVASAAFAGLAASAARL
jgi:hypothetical protein